VSAGQAVRTPCLKLKEEIEQPMQWDAEQLHLLLTNLGFVNKFKPEPRQTFITLKEVSEMVSPFGWRMVAPLVYTGVETLAMMSADLVGHTSCINPHGDLKWMAFGRDNLSYTDVLLELWEF